MNMEERTKKLKEKVLKREEQKLSLSCHIKGLKNAKIIRLDCDGNIIKKELEK